MKRGLFTSVLCLVCLTPAHAQSPSKSATVSFTLLPTKHMVVKIKINGTGPYPVVFDTGAPVNLINNKTARDAGLIDKKGGQSMISPLGPFLMTRMKSVGIGGLEIESVPVIVLDHPAVKVMSEEFGPVEGIIGFPFFARYAMTLDYQAKKLTFVPSAFRPADVLLGLVGALLAPDQKPAAKVLAAAGLWGLTVEKPKGDDEAGVNVKTVLADSAAAKAGLQAGDRLLTLDDRWTDSVADCYTAAGYVQPGTKVQVKVRRDDREVELSVTPQAGL